MAAVLAAIDPGAWHAVLSIIAIVLFVYGVVCIFRGAIGLGVALIILACLVGPGGISLLS